MVYAVDSRGDVLEKIIRLRPDVDEARAFQLMQEELDRVDPVPVLRLVSEPAPASAPRMLSVAQLDALYREHADPVSALLYLRKRERLRRALR